jgi:pimeloyl-ACP methyl ester carboxylesterase
MKTRIGGAGVTNGIALAACAWAATASAQALDDIQTPEEPLVLREQGSFFVGGESVEATAMELMSFTDEPAPVAGHVTVNQMYVSYMVPEGATGSPVVMIHGGTVTGKTYETTPDGRMGWSEYFVRQGHPVYVPDQVGRARSGADISFYNRVRTGEAPLGALPNVFRHADEQNWTLWRFGPAAGEAFPDTQFPVEAAGELSKQSVPDLIFTLPDPNPNVAATADLSARLEGAVLMGHSQTGRLPLEAALADPAGVRGMILVEPGGCRADTWTDEEIAALAPIPTLVVFGDHLEAETRLPAMNWQSVYEDCQAFIERVNARNGNAEMLHPPELGIHGNTHLIMMDRNNLQIADLILAWIEENVAAE